jgi:A/G-specific adenine glycosylase
VLVAEVMLQQTQVARVLPAYVAWVARWPSAQALAAASRAEVLRAWAGLGYNRRAVALHEAARAIAAAGTFPDQVEALQRLPGVGPYTARAVACFAFGTPVMPVDTNVGRVLARHIFGHESARVLGRRPFLQAADGWLRSAAEPREAALAVMDLGALVCRPTPHCDLCPVSAHCRWQAAGCPPEPNRARSEPPFERTVRYARGRLLALLRERGRVTAEEASLTLPPWHRPRASAYLDALVRDGLAEPDGSGWRLPELTEG